MKGHTKYIICVIVYVIKCSNIRLSIKEKEVYIKWTRNGKVYYTGYKIMGESNDILLSSKEDVKRFVEFINRVIGSSLTIEQWQ